MNATPGLVRCEAATTYLFYSPCCRAEVRPYAATADNKRMSANCPCCHKPLTLIRHGDTFSIEER